jgi:16S rRNA (guanine527-N7)-methyltransferase
LFSLPSDLRALDLGTGGGLPGIPIAILRPDMRVTLLDSIRKKTDSVRSILGEIGVGNAEVRNARAESSLFVREFHGRFDIVLARSVGPLKTLMEWAFPLLRKSNRRGSHGPNGKPVPPFLLAYKGGDLSSEIEEASRSFPGSVITEHDLVFEGVTDESLQGKKILIVKG